MHVQGTNSGVVLRQAGYRGVERGRVWEEMEEETAGYKESDKVGGKREESRGKEGQTVTPHWVDKMAGRDGFFFVCVCGTV